MLTDVFSLLKDAGAIFAVGTVIKLMDDYLDKALDEKIGYQSLVLKLKEGILPYSLLLFSVALLLNKELTLALFFASYILGMFNDMTRKQSFKLKGYQESILVLIISFHFLGFFFTVLGLSLIFIIQLIDDFLDLKEDKMTGKYNIINNIGTVEAQVIFLFFLITAIYLSIYYTVVILVIFFIMNRLFFKRRT